MKKLVNEDKQLIQEDIPTILQYLFRNYGRVPMAGVKQKETEIREMTYRPVDPLIVLYGLVEKFKNWLLWLRFLIQKTNCSTLP